MKGEEQKKLNVLSSDIMADSLCASGRAGELVSEELDEVVIIDDAYKGKCCVVVESLDDSSNISGNISTIPGIIEP